MSYSELKALKAELDARVEAEKQAGELTLKTALAWWDVATAMRDLRETNAAFQTMH